MLLSVLSAGEMKACLGASRVTERAVGISGRRSPAGKRAGDDGPLVAVLPVRLRGRDGPGSAPATETDAGRAGPDDAPGR